MGGSALLGGWVGCVRCGRQRYVRGVGDGDEQEEVGRTL